MKKTQRKDLLRNIRKQWVSFLSIVIIALLGVTAFLGIDYTAAILRRNGSDIYNRLNFRDIEVVSTLLLSEEDLKDLQKVEGVVDLEAVRQTSATVTCDGKSESVNVISLTERVNRTEVVSGRLPETVDECAVEAPLAQNLGLAVGDRISPSDTEGNKAKYLVGDSYTVTGIIHHSDHINNIISEAAYILVLPAAFDEEELNGCYMKAEIVVEKSENANRFSRDYENSVATVLNRIDELAFTDTARRDSEIIRAAQKPLSEAKEQLESGFEQLESAKALVRNKLRDMVEIVFKQNSEKELFHWATEQKANVDSPSETAKYLWLTDNLRVDLSRSPEDVFRAIVASESLSDRLLVSIYEYLQNSEAPVTGDGSYDMDAVREALVAKATAYAKDYQALSEGCVAWDEGHDQYIAGLETYRQKTAELQPCRWLCFDVKGNASYAQLMIGSANFSNLRMTFSVMFVLVGALVIFATVGKMVDEQRGLVGTTKALGFFNREIFAKYLSFGVLATLIGTILGVLVARFAIEPFLLGTLNTYYEFDVSKPGVVLHTTIIAVVAGVLLAVVSVWFACNKLLREPAVRLMQPKSPGVKKGRAKGGKRFLSLYSRLILLNIRTDLKRVIVTIVSVAGCCALVIIGLTLRSGIMGSVEKQYGEVVDYDFCVQYDPNVAKEGGAEFGVLLKAENAEATNLLSTSATYYFSDLQIAEVYCGNLQEICQFYHLYDWKTGELIRQTDRGVLIQRRMAEIYGLDVGSEFELSIGGTKTATVRVAGVFENYLGRTIMMSGDYYKRAYNEPMQPNAYFVRVGNANAAQLESSLRALDGFETITGSDSNRSIIESSVSSLNTVVLLFIFIAGVMAGVVQLNLTNMYVLQKKREMTIMRINGFTTKEVIGYILRETVLTTIIGIVLGIAAGTGLAYSIVRTLEQTFLQFKRSPDFVAWALAAVITVAFTVIVNAIALRNVKNLRLTDVA